MVRSPRFPFPCLRKEGSAGESVPGIPSLKTWSVNAGTSVWLSRVFPRDPHSDQRVGCGCTYNRKMSRVRCSYSAVQRLNRYNGKDINTVQIFVSGQPEKQFW